MAEESKPLVEETAAVEVVEEPQEKAPPVLVEASQQVESKSGNKDTQQIMNKIFNGEDFATYRSRCLEKPDRAYYTLGPYARLTVEMLEARRLIPCSTSSFDTYFGDQPDAFIKVLVDDTMKYQTKTISNSKNPKWEDKQVFDIVANRSMIRLHVYDSDGDEKSHKVDPLGFVEFSTGDIPYGEEIDGWFELRFPANLQGTNLDRFAEHSEKREEEWAKANGITSSTKPPQDGDLEEGGGAAEPEEEKDASRKVHHKLPTSFVSRAMKRAKTGMAKAAAAVTGSEHVDTSSDDVQFNAGEIRVRLKLEKLNPESNDELFAHALTPSYFTYASFVQEEALPKLDVQELVDDVMDIKIKLLDDMIFSFYTFILYILSWRSYVLSGTLLLAFCSAVKSASLVYGVLHVWLACVLLYLSNPSWRNEISTGGLNAPLTQEGYVMVAAWDKTDEMFTFLMRIIQARLGTVISMQDLVHFAGTLVNGVGQEPDIAYDEVLKVIHDVWFIDLPDVKELLDEGTLVRVHERRRGVVKELGKSNQNTPEEEITVKFDEEDWDNPGAATEGVHPRRVVFPRLDIPSIPTPIVPKAVKAILALCMYHVQDVKDKIMPIASQVRAFFTWQKPMYMSAVIAYLFARAALSFVAFTSKDSWSHLVIQIMSDIRNGILGLIVLALLFSRSRGVKIAVGLFNLAKNYAIVAPRPAPGNWAFYKAADQPYETITPS